MKNLYLLLLLTAFHCQCLAQTHSSNYLDSLNSTREKFLWIIHFPDSKTINTYNLIFLRKDADSLHDLTLKEQEKFHPKAFAVIHVYPKKNIKFLNLKELFLDYKIPLKKMDLPVSVDSIMIEDPKDIIVDESNLKSIKIVHNDEINKEVIQIINITETSEIKYIKEFNKFRKEHPNDIFRVR